MPIRNLSKKRQRLNLWLRMRELYIRSYFKSLGHEKHFAGIESYCMFIGYPRSGHSLIGSLLDAHPNIIIAHELDVLKYIQEGFSKRQVFYLLLENSRRFTQVGREWSGYAYAVRNQWNGKFRQLKVIGDKKGGGSSRRLGRNPELFQDLKRTIDIDQKYIHVIRNPYDNISTMSKRRGEGLSKSIDRYFSRCKTVANINAMVDREKWFDVRHEALIDNPQYWLMKLCQFLGQNTSDDYLNDCASIVRKSPHKTRHEAHWTRELMQRVENERERYPFLHSYTFD